MLAIFIALNIGCTIRLSILMVVLLRVVSIVMRVNLCIGDDWSIWMLIKREVAAVEAFII